VFITLEGLDGSGGTTQVERLRAAWAARAPGREVVCTREPSPGPVGRLLRQALADVTIGEGVLPYLFAADRRDHLDRVVLPALARGESVLSDRYALSSFAYQAEAHGLNRVMRLNQDFPAPHLTILLDLDPAVCLTRILARGLPRDRFETLERLRTIQQGYEAAVHAVSGGAAPWNIVPIDASADVDTIHARVVEAVWPWRA
jgi:dTMP kinase